jgi:hypothetical protein
MASSPVARARLLTRVDHRCSEAILTLLRSARRCSPRRTSSSTASRSCGTSSTGRSPMTTRSCWRASPGGPPWSSSWYRHSAVGSSCRNEVGRRRPGAKSTADTQEVGRAAALRTSPRPCWMHRQPGWNKGVSSQGPWGEQVAPGTPHRSRRLQDCGPATREGRESPLSAVAPAFAKSGPGISPGPRGGGGGNRTRVLRRITRASPSAVCVASTRPHRSCRQVDVTGPVTVRCPARARDRRAQ